MRLIACGLALAGALALPPLIGGCAETISETETVTHKRDGTVKVNKETVKEHPDGSISVEKKTEVDRDID
jgi:hypothetical protein